MFPSTNRALYHFLSLLHFLSSLSPAFSRDMCNFELAGERQTFFFASTFSLRYSLRLNIRNKYSIHVETWQISGSLLSIHISAKVNLEYKLGIQTWNPKWKLKFESKAGSNMESNIESNKECNLIFKRVILNWNQKNWTQNWQFYPSVYAWNCMY